MSGSDRDRIDVEALRQTVERWEGQPATPEDGDARAAVARLLHALEVGAVRAAEPGPDGWRAVPWVKSGILLAFRVGRTARLGGTEEGSGGAEFFDRDTLPLRRTAGVEENIRIVPGGSSVRAGAYLAPRVVIMPPAYVNVGAWVGEGTMVDSHALVGSCAQIGRGVHLSAGAQIGGVLEPVGLRPVIVEDEVMVGANTGLFEGVLVGRRAVLAPGVILTASTPLYDLVNGEVLRGTVDAPLSVPPGAVVVPGTRPASGAFAREHGLSLYAPMIVKYRDERTDAATALEGALR
jgi:2,3,4,5-tetrahydropyridine-2,6-dicarboxylate N-succinyltransferase